MFIPYAVSEIASFLCKREGVLCIPARYKFSMYSYGETEDEARVASK